MIIIRHIIRFIILIALQVFILNKVQFSGYINPYLYILFIILLPFETPKWLLLILGFLLGLTVDFFVQTPGMHASASLFMAFIRPFVIASVSSKREYEQGIQPVIQDLGLNWFLTYASILTVAHHTLLFLIEAFHFNEFFITIGRVLISSIFTLLLIVITQYLFYKPKRNIVTGKI
ncbi:MAG: rod shape-determining protein MreD [Bacteroidales bacterium]|nr:rod shape-determining protein MreD [Bacteroidales bacterium]